MLAHRANPSVCYEQDDRGHCRVCLRGEIDVCNAGELADALDAALRGRPTRLVFDLSETTFIDGAAISRIVRAGSTAAGDCPVVIRNPRPVVVKALAALGLDGFCRVEHDPGGQPPPPGP